MLVMPQSSDRVMTSLLGFFSHPGIAKPSPHSRCHKKAGIANTYETRIGAFENNSPGLVMAAILSPTMDDILDRYNSLILRSRNHSGLNSDARILLLEAHTWLQFLCFWLHRLYRDDFAFCPKEKSPTQVLPTRRNSGAPEFRPL